jgi:hypothetical protein
MKRIVKSERGQALPMALILLLLGGFLVVPTLGLMTTSLTANRQVDRANLELYAADAGMEKILWNIQYNQYDPQDNPDGFKLPKDGDPPTQLPEFTLNVRTVDVQISKSAGQPYKIISTATSADEHSTTVECYLNATGDLSWFFDSAITSAKNVTIQPGTVVTGDVTYGTEDGLDNKGEIIGEKIYDPDLANNWPSAEYFYNYYYAQVETAPDIADGTTINIANYTVANPFSLWQGGSAHALGNLNITGKGWAILDGTLFVEGSLNVQPDCTIDLNGHTIFVAYPYPTPYTKGDVAINFQPDSSLVGSGCIIAVGDIIFKPKLGAGDKIIGVDDDIGFQGSAPKDTLLLSKFTADVNGDVEFFRVTCSGSDNVKVAMYDANGAEGGPGALLGISNEGESTAVISGCNDIAFPETPVTAGNSYWLAAIADKAIICQNTQAGTSLQEAALYSSFVFTDYPTGLQPATGTTYLFSGHTVPFVFIMSIEGTSDIKPGGTFYGSIAGSAEVELYPHCTLTLTEVPDEGLNFPGSSGSSGVGTKPTILTYTIKSHPKPPD